jgi:hypothetical protein
VCGVAYHSDSCWDSNHSYLLPVDELDSRIADECYAMASFTLLEAQLKPFKASDVACAILYFVRRALSVVPVWSPELTALTRTCPTSEGVVNVLRAFDSLLVSRSPQSPPPPPSLKDKSPRSTRNGDPGMSTPVTTRSSRDGREMDDLSALVHSVSLTPGPEGARADSVQWHEGQFTPEEKENKFGKGNKLPSPLSVIEMESLERVVGA